jgi:hypothetical protein
MNLLMRLLVKWQKRNACKCSSPTFIVRGGRVVCMNCDKFIHKEDMVIV